MALALPLELQLYILEFATPPLTRKHLTEHRELMRTWTLVCRDWRDEASRIVSNAPKLAFSDTTWETICSLDDRLALKTAHRTVTRLEVEVEDPIECRPDDYFETTYPTWTLKSSRVEELWITAPVLPKLVDFHHLRRLNMHYQYEGTPRHFRLPNLWPASIVSLHVRGVEVEVFPPALHSLVLDWCMYRRSALNSLRNLRLLAIRQATFDLNGTPILEDLTRALPALEHAYFAQPCWCSWNRYMEKFEVVETPPLKLPQSLQSLTFRSCPFDTGIRGALRTACEAQGTRFVDVSCAVADEGDWVAKEWGLSLG
ncbi:hypothetical protein JCM3770_005665 [Rhodotorula araucariae]